MKRFLFYLIGIFLCVTNICSQELSSKEEEDLIQRVVECYNDFISYLPEITTKAVRPMEERRLAQKYIAKVLNLFIGEGYDYQYLDEQGELKMHKAVSVYVISKDSVQNPPRLLRVFLPRLMATNHLKYELSSLDTAELSIKKTLDMPDNALFSVVNKNDKPVAYIFNMIVETPEGNDVLYYPKLTDITLIEK